MILYEWARRLNRARKARIRAEQDRYVSAVRRIERVKTTERVCAMTFDDGPMALPSSPDVGGGAPLTRLLADALLEHGFRATFDVVGDTSDNYPDRAGKPGSFYWGGEKYDHYPRLGEDARGGAKNCPELVRYLLDRGFELSNHGYRHRLLGFSPVYYKRRPFSGPAEAESDLRALHDLLARDYGYTLRLARPPHYIDGVKGGLSAYDLYELMGYQYMAASFDGGGWLPKPDYDAAVEAMVAPVRAALARDPDAFCGQIIFQKDGCDMNGMSPVASALPQQLRLLAEHGYRVVSVGALLAEAAFADVGAEDPCFGAAKALAADGRPVAFRFNGLRPDEPWTWGQACMLLCPPAAREKRIRARMAGQGTLGRRDARHPYAGALHWADGLGVVREADAPVTGAELGALCAAAGWPAPAHPGAYTRRKGILLAAELLGAQGRE